VADSDDFARKTGRGKVVVKQGGGPPPGYSWNVFVLETARKEANKEYNESQYYRLSVEVRELARQAVPTQRITVDVQPIGGFYEIRSKGGVLGKINARVFFFVDAKSQSIVVLGTIKKEDEDQTPPYVVRLMARRMREYLNMQSLGEAKGGFPSKE
jgi:hypothetical protein